MKQTHIARVLVLALLTVVFVTCSSDTDTYRQPRSYPGGADGERPGGFARANSGGGDGLDMMPPADWWKDPRISVAVALSADQVASLEKTGHEQGDEIAKLERDSMVAARDLRETIDSSQPTAADIIAAGQRVRGIRDALFDRRVQLVAAERTLLTQTQWRALQQAIADSHKATDRPNRGNMGGRGRGGMGGRGRFPG